MDESESAIKDFASKGGKHDTTIHELHRPAVTHTHILPTEHTAETVVVDHEVHQHHHHTSIQPITHREVLPEKHHHRIIPVEHKEHHHGDHKAIEERLAAEAAQFKDITETGKIEYTQERKPVIRATHIHHHVHEIIQPVIQKETIQPTIIHSTIPIHEVHHNEPKHHAATALSAITMEEFKKRGGSLTGRPERTDRFEGEPHAETPEQHAKHAGLHRHGLTDGVPAGEVGAAAARKDGVTSRSPRGSAERERARHSPEADAAAAGAGAAAVTAAETRHHDHANAKVDPRVDNRVDPAKRSGFVETDRTAASKLHKEPPTQYADTHAGSKMDTVADRDVGVATTTAGDKAVNAGHHHSNSEAANVKRSTAPVTEITANERKKRSSLLGRLKPRRDS